LASFLDSGEDSGNRQKCFIFEKQWIQEPDFLDIFTRNWQQILVRFHDQRYSMDVWHGCLGLTRKYLRGWNSNKVRDAKRDKVEILKKLKEMDELFELQKVGAGFWSKMYQLES
jgi:hypothetical protein